ncbi:hypothetical protein CGRA01v4_01945 [Colletotrichum graminicola]|nr:hypothetical protein CGRA01v4_01945 [Colletotrichum graminicola]
MTPPRGLEPEMSRLTVGRLRHSRLNRPPRSSILMVRLAKTSNWDVRARPPTPLLTEDGRDCRGSQVNFSLRLSRRNWW